MITSNRQKIRRNVSPLSVSQSVRCTTPASPITQVFDASGADGAQYSPDRSLFPTVLQPDIYASASDGSWPNGKANALIANVKWFCDGVDISLDPSWTGLYSIHTADDDSKGALQINRNVGVGEILELVMKADLVDTRTMNVIKVETEPTTLSTIAKSEDTYSLDILEGEMVYYNQEDDRLALDDYNRAHDLKSLTDAERSAVRSEKTSYLREIPLSLRRGPREIGVSGDILFRIYRVASDGILTELAGQFDEMVCRPAEGKSLIIDMRLTEGGCYLIRALRVSGNSERELTRAQFQVKRRERAYSVSTNNMASMSGADSARTDLATVKCGSRVVQQPDRMMRIKWFSENSAGKKVIHNTGSIGKISLVRAGVASANGRQISGELSVWCEAELKPVYRFVRANAKLIKLNGRPVIMN